MNARKFICVLALAGISVASHALTQWRDGELLFKLKPNANSTVIALAAVGMTEMERYPQIGWVRVRFSVAGRTIGQASTALSRLPFVSRVEKNLLRFPTALPNDPMTGQQWVIDRIDLPEAWDITTGDPTVKVAVIDTGVQLDHPDLFGKFTSDSRDVVDNDNDPTDEGGIGHGTHVSGIIAAGTNNSVGIAGVGYNIKVMAIRAGDFGFSEADLLEAIIWASDNNANVINMSLGGSGTSQAEQDAVTYARNNNVFVCASAGNNGTTQKSYPAALVGCMAVASSDPDDSRSSFSQYGNWVHVTAPGSQILSTVLGSGYESWDGTSMSCPVVAGVAGLIWSRGGPSMTSQDVFDAITDSCDPVQGNYVIFGRVNAHTAVLSTTITAQTQLTMLTADMFVGTSSTGSSADLEFADGTFLQMITATQGRAGSQGGIEMTAQLDRPLNELFDFNFKFRTKSSIASTGMVWLWNYQFNRWDFKKSFPTRVTESDSVVTVANMNRYVDSNGLVSIRLRGHIPVNRAGGTTQWLYSVDFAQLEASFEAPPP